MPRADKASINCSTSSSVRARPSLGRSGIHQRFRTYTVPVSARYLAKRARRLASANSVCAPRASSAWAVCRNSSGPKRMTFPNGLEHDVLQALLQRCCTARRRVPITGIPQGTKAGPDPSVFRRNSTGCGGSALRIFSSFCLAV